MRTDEQISTQLAGGSALATSNSVELELGARGALLLVDGAFRLDACPLGDTIKLVARALEGVELTSRGEGYAGGVIAKVEQFKRLRGLRPCSFALEVETLREGHRRSASVLVGALQLADRGTTQFTAQAVVTDV